ncbi:MAG: hypothetical protein AB8E15_03535 [Bdellovibrionales bacterium]
MLVLMVLFSIYLRENIVSVGRIDPNLILLVSLVFSMGIVCGKFDIDPFFDYKKKMGLIYILNESIQLLWVSLVVSFVSPSLFSGEPSFTIIGTLVLLIRIIQRAIGVYLPNWQIHNWAKWLRFSVLPFGAGIIVILWMGSSYV